MIRCSEEPDCLWQQRRDELESKSLLRTLRVTCGPSAACVTTSDGAHFQFCSNDYLGLAGDPRIAAAMTGAMTQFGSGAGASRLVSGNTSLHEELESVWAAWMGFPQAVSFPSGYQANAGAISALTDVGDTIYSDERVHASIIDGCRLSRAQVVIFRHNDMNHLDELLSHSPGGGLRLIVTDAVFSMDGDEAPLGSICDIAQRHGARVYLDEAHTVGITGCEGRGMAHREGLSGCVDVHVSTFGKAFGLCGAIVATSESAAALIRSRARSFLYTTAAPAFLSAGVRRSLEIIQSADPLRIRLNENVAHFRQRARDAQLPLLESTTPIQPLVIGDAATALRVSCELWRAGFFVQAIRPPTVPQGTSRLRVTLTAAHEDHHINALVEALAACIPESRGRT